MLDRRNFFVRRAGYIFIVIVVVLFLQGGFYAGHQSSESPSSKESGSGSGWSLFSDTKSSSGVVRKHPIAQMMEEGEVAFRKKVEKQSSTLKEAVAEYKRRYKRQPPRDFDKWWDFTRQYNHIMVDEYDGLMRDLDPFFQLSGEEIRRRVQQVGSLPSIDILRIQDGTPKLINYGKGFEDDEVSARAKGLRSMLGKVMKTLPDMDFPINAKAEGRVIVPWEHRQYPNLTKEDSSIGVEAMLGGPFIADWRGDGNVWDAWRRTCDPSSTARRLFSSIRSTFSPNSRNYLTTRDKAPPEDDFTFARDTGFHTTDFCNSPHDHYNQGHFFSDWRTIPVLYPVFSPARAAGFMDIKIPSHYYYGSTPEYTYGWDPVNLELKDVDDMEVPWEEKQEKIFWRGATTGGGNSPPGFSPQYQRHRFVRMTSDVSNETQTVVFADPPNTTNYVKAEVSVAELNRDIMDVAFVKATNPDQYPGGLQALMDDHRFGSAVPLGRHWEYKYLVDFDGMSYSGRFMSFLASDSVPLKATVYEEFFSDWIQPWVHFIPLTTSYKEIYNIFSYFSGPTEEALRVVNSTRLYVEPGEERVGVVSDGDNQLRRIARAGRQWKRSMGRTLDQEAFVYRLALEWARLWSDDRDSMNYVES